MKYIASCSGGKDSIATIILAHENNEPLDEIIFAEVMFDENISGELPEHIDFIKNKAFPLFESWGYKTTILHGKKTYLDIFHHIVKNPRKHKERAGMKAGFVMVGRCNVQVYCKLNPIKHYFKEQSKEITQYVGIAIDEPRRLDIMRKSNNKVSLLEKYEYTEEMAKELCVKYDLLSPQYNITHRGGCWFCPNMLDEGLKHIRRNHNDLWKKLLELEDEPNLVGNIWNTLHNESIHQKEEEFSLEDAQMNIFDFIESEE